MKPIFSIAGPFTATQINAGPIAALSVPIVIAPDADASMRWRSQGQVRVVKDAVGLFDNCSVIAHAGNGRGGLLIQTAEEEQTTWDIGPTASVNDALHDYTVVLHSDGSMSAYKDGEKLTTLMDGNGTRTDALTFDAILDSAVSGAIAESLAVLGV